jgi:heat shock protein HslJ
VLAVVAAAFLVVACGGSKIDDSNSLQAHQWKAVTVSGQPATVGQPITAAFENGTIKGSTGVNQYQGSYTTSSGNSISIKLGPMTHAAGTPAAMKLESAYIAALGQAATYKVDDATLTLLNSSGAQLVVYNIFKPASLTGTEWECTMYNNGRGGFQSVLATSSITAKFGTDGSLSGNGGVNQYNTTYTTSGSSITIKPPMSTMMAGPEELMNQEAAYLAALPQAATYTIEGSQLTLRAADGAAMAGYVAK